MDTRMSIHSARYCDMGPYDGKMRIDFEGSVYLDEEEMRKFGEAGLRFEIVIPEKE